MSMLPQYEGKTFWCIKPNLLQQARRNLAPMEPYEGRLIKGPGKYNWDLVPLLYEEYAHTKAVDLRTAIDNSDELFTTQAAASRAYVQVQTRYVAQLETDLAGAQHDLREFSNKMETK